MPPQSAALNAGTWHPTGDHAGARERRAGSVSGGGQALPAPTRLATETRDSFRRDALAFVERCAQERRASVDLDLGPTTEIDASGLGILVLIQRRSRTYGLPTRLLQAREQVRRLLTLTKLDYLFEFVD